MEERKIGEKSRYFCVYFRPGPIWGVMNCVTGGKGEGGRMRWYKYDGTLVGVFLLQRERE